MHLYEQTHLPLLTQFTYANLCCNRKYRSFVHVEIYEKYMLKFIKSWTL